MPTIIHYCFDKPSCKKTSYHSSLLKLIDYYSRLVSEEDEDMNSDLI